MTGTQSHRRLEPWVKADGTSPSADVDAVVRTATVLVAVAAAVGAALMVHGYERVLVAPYVWGLVIIAGAVTALAVVVAGRLRRRFVAPVALASAAVAVAAGLVVPRLVQHLPGDSGVLWSIPAGRDEAVSVQLDGTLLLVSGASVRIIAIRDGHQVGPSVPTTTTRWLTGGGRYFGVGPDRVIVLDPRTGARSEIVGDVAEPIDTDVIAASTRSVAVETCSRVSRSCAVSGFSFDGTRRWGPVPTLSASADLRLPVEQRLPVAAVGPESTVVGSYAVTVSRASGTVGAENAAFRFLDADTGRLVAETTGEQATSLGTAIVTVRTDPADDTECEVAAQTPGSPPRTYRSACASARGVAEGDFVFLSDSAAHTGYTAVDVRHSDVDSAVTILRSGRVFTGAESDSLANPFSLNTLSVSDQGVTDNLGNEIEGYPTTAHDEDSVFWVHRLADNAVEVATGEGATVVEGPAPRTRRLFRSPDARRSLTDVVRQSDGRRTARVRTTGGSDALTPVGPGCAVMITDHRVLGLGTCR